MEDDPSGLRVAFEDRDAGRIAVCGTSGRDSRFITPDSLVAFSPVTDSTQSTVYFLARLRALPEDLTALYVPPRWAHRSVCTSRQADLVTFFAYPGNAGPDYGTIEQLGFRKLVIEGEKGIEIIDNPRYQGR